MVVSAQRLLALYITYCVMQVALWLVWKSTADREKLAVPLTMFGISLALGNWWNGEAPTFCNDMQMQFIPAQHANSYML